MANRPHRNPHGKAPASAWLGPVILALSAAGVLLWPASAPLPACINIWP